jgi:hypothetical protein
MVWGWSTRSCRRSQRTCMPRRARSSFCSRVTSRSPASRCSSRVSSPAASAPSARWSPGSINGSTQPIRTGWATCHGSLTSTNDRRVTGSQVASNWRLRPLAALERSGPETGGDGLVLERLGLLRSAGAAGRDYVSGRSTSECFRCHPSDHGVSGRRPHVSGVRTRMLLRGMQARVQFRRGRLRVVPSGSCAGREERRHTPDRVDLRPRRSSSSRA